MILAFALIAGGAWAATRSSSRTIHACYAKRGGALRIASRCRRGEKALTWNQTGAPGVQGPAGTPGAAGLRGVEGAQGPSDVFASGTAAQALSPSYFRAGLVTVPAGSYLVQATATYFANTASSMLCLLEIEQAGVQTELDGATASAGAGSANTLALSGVAIALNEAPIELRCRPQGAGAEGTIDNAHLTAVKVASLHGTLPVD